MSLPFLVLSVNGSQLIVMFLGFVRVRVNAGEEFGISSQSTLNVFEYAIPYPTPFFGLTLYF